MITEALLDKIKALISGYKQPAHPLYGKSDKEVAEVIKSMVSGYLTESKQLIVEKNWKPPGVDPAKTYSGTRFPSKNYKNTFLKFKQELKDNFGINVESTSAWRDAYNQARIMYVNWCQKSKNLRRTGENDKSLLRRRRAYLTGLYKNKQTAGKLADIFDQYWIESHDSNDWISSKQLTRALDRAELLLQKNPVSKHQAKTAVDITGYGASNIKKIEDFVNGGKSKYAKSALYETDHFHIVLKIDNKDNTNAVSTKSNVLQYGDSGEAVTKLQNQLAVLYTTAPLGTSGIDGKFGPKTRDLLKKYQREHGLPVSGKLTSVTKAELEKVDMSAEDAVADLQVKSQPKIRKGTPTGPIAPTDPEVDSISTQKIDTLRPQTIEQLPLLRYGSSGPDVKNVQSKLINLYGDKILPKHGADGKFKSETQTAIKKFQRDNKLSVDGIVGQNTYKTLYKYFPTVTVKAKQDMESDTNNDLAVDDLKEMIQQWPLYRKILKEETQRARILMFEYNEEEIWNAMSDPEKSQALMSADDDMGPDFADEFTETPWLDIPDVITNRIDLRPYDKPEKEQLSRQDFMSKNTDMRGMSYQAKEDDAYKRFIEAYLKKQNIQIDYNQSRPLYKALNQLNKDQVRDLFFKAHDFRASMSKFVPPTPEEEADSVKNMANIINQDRIDNPGFSRD